MTGKQLDFLLLCICLEHAVCAGLVLVDWHLRHRRLPPSLKGQVSRRTFTEHSILQRHDNASENLDPRDPIDARPCYQRFPEGLGAERTVPLILNPMSALPQCEGEQWIVDVPDELAHLVAMVLVGQAFHAALILEGTQLGTPKITAKLKDTLDRDLHTTSEKGIEHRDGLLFEIICWIAARKGKSGNEKIDNSHLKATNQGTDGVKVTVDPTTKALTKATVYEYKCTIHARQKFQSQVLKSFRQYISGGRDNQLAQAVLALLENYGLAAAQLKTAYDTLIQTRPLAFEASLTVAPSLFPAAKCVALFKDYDSLPVATGVRGGNTLPLDDVRGWFADFANRVWAQIEQFNV